MAGDAERDYWRAVAARIGERCDFYSAEDLAAFAEGRLRGRNARALEAHLKDCDDCRSVVEELRRELAPEPASVRVRFAPARGWIWALAAGAVATVLIAVVVLRPGGPGVRPPGSGVGPRPPVNVAEAPPPGTGVHPSPPPGEAPQAVAQTPPERGHRHRRPPAGAEPPEETTGPAADVVNVLPPATSLAFAEPLATHQTTTAEVEELLRQGAVNDLPGKASEPSDKALIDEFYRGFDDLVQDLRTEGEGAGQ